MPLPLFGSKFSPKKTPPRRSKSLSNLQIDAAAARQEFGPDVSPVKLNLGDHEVAFENGVWINEPSVGGVVTGGGGGQREAMLFRKKNQQLEDENNLLKLKIDILLDMLAELSAVSHFRENELAQLRGPKKR